MQLQNCQAPFLPRHFQYIERGLLPCTFQVGSRDLSLQVFDSSRPEFAQHGHTLKEHLAHTLFDNIGFVDAYRSKNPDTIEYTWWSNRANAWANNVGWRIDYQIITPDLKQTIQSTEIYREQKFSDHAPLLIEYNFKINTPQDNPKDN